MVVTAVWFSATVSVAAAPPPSETISGAPLGAYNWPRMSSSAADVLWLLQIVSSMPLPSTATSGSHSNRSVTVLTMTSPPTRAPFASKYCAANRAIDVVAAGG